MNSEHGADYDGSFRGFRGRGRGRGRGFQGGPPFRGRGGYQHGEEEYREEGFNDWSDPPDRLERGGAGAYNDISRPGSRASLDKTSARPRDGIRGSNPGDKTIAPDQGHYRGQRFGDGDDRNFGPDNYNDYSGNNHFNNRNNYGTEYTQGNSWEQSNQNFSGGDDINYDEGDESWGGSQSSSVQIRDLDEEFASRMEKRLQYYDDEPQQDYQENQRGEFRNFGSGNMNDQSYSRGGRNDSYSGRDQNWRETGNSGSDHNRYGDENLNNFELEKSGQEWNTNYGNCGTCIHCQTAHV